jgi:hypothetical protein
MGVPVFHEVKMIGLLRIGYPLYRREAATF